MRHWLAVGWLCLVPGAIAAQVAPARDTDLDRFMAAVVAKRDDNWKKLQQYILHERQRVDVTGPEGLRLYGTVHDYQWFVKDGFFIRSPLSANGVTVSESERRRYEERYLRRMRERDQRKAKKDAERGVTTPPATDDSVGDLLRQQAEPSFVSAAYFMEFEFEPGRYALAGREMLDGREVLRIEYHPAKLFDDDDDEEVRVDVGSKGASVSRTERDAARQRRRERERQRRDDEVEDRIEQQMNKTSLVTLWVLRDEKQIVRYVFDNVDWGFLPGRSVVRIDDLSASMRMHQPFPGVWLPQAISGRARVVTAFGKVGADYDVGYSDYRQAGVTVRVK